MAQDKYAGEPLIWQIQDYGNELSTFPLMLGLLQLTRKIDSHAPVSDNVFHEVMMQTREMHKIQTLRERFSPENLAVFETESPEIILGWIEKSPLRVARADALVQILNTTDSVRDYKLTTNELVDVLGLDIKTRFPIAEEAPVSKAPSVVKKPKPPGA